MLEHRHHLSWDIYSRVFFCELFVGFYWETQKLKRSWIRLSILILLHTFGIVCAEPKKKYTAHEGK